MSITQPGHFRALDHVGYAVGDLDRSIPFSEVPYKGGIACYLRDPDGISIELMEEPPGGPDWTD